MQTKLHRFAQSLRPLVASDYDGTLARIGTETSPATPQPRAAAALWRLSHVPGISVAILSGRSPAQLSQVSEGFGPAWLVSEHGTACANPEGMPVADWPCPSERAALSEAANRAMAAAGEVRGIVVEPKSNSIALNLSMVAGHLREKAFGLAEDWGRGCVGSGLRLVRGREMVEALDPELRRLPALSRVISLTGADFTVYAGDDTTDEECIQEMSRRDDALGVWVRSERTPLPDFAPDCIVDGPEEWAILLEKLLALRRGEGSPGEDA